MPRKKKEDMPADAFAENDRATEGASGYCDAEESDEFAPCAARDGNAADGEETDGYGAPADAGIGKSEDHVPVGSENAPDSEHCGADGNENPEAQGNTEDFGGMRENTDLGRDAEPESETAEDAHAESEPKPDSADDAHAEARDDGGAMPCGDGPSRDALTPCAEEIKPEPEAETPQDAGETPPREDAAALRTNAEIDAPEPSAKTPRTKTVRKTAPARKRTLSDLDLNALDGRLSEEEQREWNALYASYRAKSLLTGTVAGADETPFDVRNRETGEKERRKMISLIVIEYRVKVLIPESEVWMPGEERPGHVLRNTVGAVTDYVVMEIDREGECAIASRRLALAAKRRFFAKSDHREGELLKCRVMAAGAKQCTVECNGFDIRLTQRDLCYTAVADLREKYRPGRELPCILKSYDRREGRLEISVKEVNPNPFSGADKRHPIGSRRQAVISGKYGGGVFCTLPDDTVCLCLYSAGHADADFAAGDSVIIVIRQYDYARKLIYGRILAKW